MKSVKPFLIRAEAENLKKGTRGQRRSKRKNPPLPEGFYVDFGGVNFGECPPIDAMLMPTLNAALRPLPRAIDEAILQRGLLPRTVSLGLTMARFLSFALLPARAAQESFEIRSSILLADAHHFQGVWMDEFVGESNDVFETGHRFVDITDAFMERAQELSKNRKFRAVMHAMGDPAECLKQLGRCKLWNERERADLVSTITRYDLQECDTLLSNRPESVTSKIAG
jgi:hypothetical protein